MTFRLSASKLKRYLQCPRSYFLKYVQGVPEDVRGKYLEVGNAFDLAVQHYVSDGQAGVRSIDPKIVRMLDSAKRYLPQPGGAQVQAQWRIETSWGFVVEAKPDLVTVRGTEWLIGDTKTTSASGPGEGSAMTPDQLHRDVQARLYAWCAHEMGAANVRATWVYTNKATKPASWTVDAWWNFSDLHEWFDSVVRPAAAAMAKLHAEYDADRVVADLDACERCWVRAHCSPFDGPNSYDGVAGLIEPASLKRTRPTLSAGKAEENSNGRMCERNDVGVDLPLVRGVGVLVGATYREEGVNMAFDLKQLNEDVDLTEALTASVKAVKKSQPLVTDLATVLDAEAVAINPPPAMARSFRLECGCTSRREHSTGWCEKRRKETPAESKLENLASELQTVVDTCQGAIARLDRMLAELRGGQ